MDCLIFPSADASTRCIEMLKSKHPSEEIQRVVFSLARSTNTEESRWTTLFVIVYPEACARSAMFFWKIFGYGISSRHAEYCLSVFPRMSSNAKNPVFQTSASSLCLEEPTPWKNSATTEKQFLKEKIATLVSSDQLGYSPVSSQDVFLFPTGMCAISAVIRALRPSQDVESEAVTYGLVTLMLNFIYAG